mmetsp:Transcript_1357/g.5242  ORF Transcript_1357/g.5242 Transcript_1357/m.5242 type:complete len:427 (-) Transcript_1357:246-1526(-)
MLVRSGTAAERTARLRLVRGVMSSSSAAVAEAARPRLAALQARLEAEAPPPLVTTTTAPAVGGDLAPTTTMRTETARPRKPAWLKASPATGPEYERLRSTVRAAGLATVCEEARCPNIGECWSGGGDASEGHHVATATIMLGGDTCTRGCRFCAVKTSRAPAALDPEEPRRVAASIAAWGLDYVVVTTVDRDDLPDQGAGHIADAVREMKRANGNLLVEVLSGDFQGRVDLVERVATSGLEVFAHNVETVERLTPRVRDRRAGYRQSLSVLEHAKSLSSANYDDVALRLGGDDGDRLGGPRAGPRLTKTSVMLGLGEREDEVRQLLRDARAAGVDVVTFGQYLRPTKRHLAVAEYVTPDAFAAWQREAEAMGFAYVASGPLVRSSYRAGELFVKNMLRRGDDSAAADKKTSLLAQAAVPAAAAAAA